MNRMGKRLMIAVAFSMAAITLTSVGYVENGIKNQLKQASMNQLENAGKSQSMIFDEDLHRVESTTNELARMVQASFDMERFKSEAGYLEKYKKSISDDVKDISESSAISHSAYVFFLPEMEQRGHSVWYADLDFNGSVELQPEFKLSYFDGDQGSKQWFYEPIKRRASFWTEPYQGNIEKDRSIIYFSYTAPVIIDGKVIAVVGNDYYFNQMRDQISHYNLNGKGYTLLLDEKQKVLIHPTISTGVNMKEYKNGAYLPLVEAIKVQSEGTLSYKWENDEPKVMSFHRLENQWTLVIAVSEKEIFADVLNFGQMKWLILIIGLFTTCVVIYQILKFSTEPMKQIVTLVKKMSQGDYSEDFSIASIHRNDEFGEVLRDLEALRVDLKRKSSNFMLDQDQLESLLQEKHDALLKTNEYLELSLGQLQEKNAEMNIVFEKYEKELSRAQKLSERLFLSEQQASMSFILTGLAHDLNSPIGNSMTMASYIKSERENLSRKLMDGTLRKNDFEEFLATLKESIELIERNLNTASNQIVQFKRLSGGQSAYFASEFSVKECLTMIFSQVNLSVTDHLIRLNLSNVDFKVRADQGAFIQVFSNLMKFTLSHSYIHQPKGMIHIKGEKISENSLQFTYEDFGNTTTDQSLERAFVPYLTTAFQNEPHMIQLNICYHVIHKSFEGSIHFEKDNEQGHKFYMIMRMNIIES